MASSLSRSPFHCKSGIFKFENTAQPAAQNPIMPSLMADAAFLKYEQPDPAAVAAARAQWEDTIRGLDERIVLVQCPDCERYLMEEEGLGWITTGYRCMVLGALLSKRFQLKNNLNGGIVGSTTFTNDSRELGVAFCLSKVSSAGIVLRHTHIVDFDVHYQYCKACSSKYEQLPCSNDDDFKAEPLDYPPFPPLPPTPSPGYVTYSG